MNAAPEWFVQARPTSREESRHALWGWVAVGVLAICWIAEGALCAARGF